MEGETLEKVIQRGKQPFSAVLDQVIQLAEGLQAAHAKGVIHRDLKPSNVILSAEADEGRQATIIDFGLAQVNWGDRLTRPGLLLGTANYICPQLLRGEAISEQSDIWSLGVMLDVDAHGTAAVRCRASGASFLHHLSRNPAPLTSLIPDLPYEIERIVAKALEKDAGRRYGAMSEFLNDLQALKRRDTVSSSRALRAQHRSQMQTARAHRLKHADKAAFLARYATAYLCGDRGNCLSRPLMVRVDRDFRIRPANSRIRSSESRCCLSSTSSVGERRGERVSRSLEESWPNGLPVFPMSGSYRLRQSASFSNEAWAEHEVSSRLDPGFSCDRLR